jgi:hypothetical protein
MHKYSIDTKERARITAYLAIISVAFVLLIQRFLGLLKINYWWFPAPSVMGVFWLFYLLFNNYLWNFKILKIIRSVKTPDISGVWKGSISTTHEGNLQPIDANLRIIQTWTTLEFELETEQSVSKSYSAHLRCDHPKDIYIYYQYLSEPKIGSPETMNIHHGTAFLKLTPDGSKLIGEYYSGRGRGTQGTMEFTRT